jgi:hypothetical protein
MEPVIQEDPSGCGIASAAALAGMEYQAMKLIAAGLGVVPEDGALWSSTGPMLKLLSSVGLSLSLPPAPFVDWASLPSPCLLAIKWRVERRGPAWHWVVFCRDHDDAYVLDPKRSLKTNKRRDFGRMKPMWLIAVQGGGVPSAKNTA